MIAAITTLTSLGLLLGMLLSLAARFFQVPDNALREELLELLPGVNCGQCGYPGCGGAADALIAGTASPALCPPGGRVLAQSLASKLGRTLGDAGDGPPLLAEIDESRCIGCAHCGKRCPTDAIVGASKQIHFVFQEACMGCGLCIEVCPTECLQLRPQTPTFATWYWPKPVLQGV
ncbi:MAG TPA: RnfABCDGE type electron transport complex subunit B [Candidatus Competibacteraceae bacterium]|nr:RnfABCDGE type electron transport complex subunit B [Candidatus Competibacteraceae bacterium]MCP5133334.1 RnfABCDGE type electron transport complex subunit B [Gammaproteobacteria bacterium]HPF59920.1 RnfABCDGE type electron transport complex subunit B [Candidatus Competibacteraceae bacterium]HRY17092.1 RnfABCDGE type electron transport complex subunit B [Candidatus Competibacteraceae bacterium]